MTDEVYLTNSCGFVQVFTPITCHFGQDFCDVLLNALSTFVKCGLLARVRTQAQNSTDKTFTLNSKHMHSWQTNLEQT